jgi:hypothetical protein
VQDTLLTPRPEVDGVPEEMGPDPGCAALSPASNSSSLSLSRAGITGVSHHTSPCQSLAISVFPSVMEY